MPDADLFREFHAAWTAGDLDRVLALADPDIVVRPIHGMLYSQEEYHGHDGLAQWYTEMTGSWDSYEAIVERVEERPGGVIGILRLVGHRGDEELAARVGSICDIRDGRV